jgi:hypothetical protein
VAAPEIDVRVLLPEQQQGHIDLGTQAVIADVSPASDQAPRPTLPAEVTIG